MRRLSCILLLSDKTPVTLVGSPHILEQLAGRKYRISASSFFQVNTQQAGTLVSLVSAYLNPSPEDTIVDLYCGVGTLSLGLAARAKQLIGIESSEAAVVDAQSNALDVGNTTFIHGLAEEVIPALDTAGPLVVVDPPRTGVDKAALAALLGLEPRRIVYVSCDPATLSRDIKVLAESGYQLQEVQPVDMFPQTYHIECVALLVRR